MAININPAHKGILTKKAKDAGLGVQEYAHKVLNNKEDYTRATIKQSQFAVNAAKWDKAADGLNIPGILQNYPQPLPVGTPQPLNAQGQPIQQYNPYGLQAMNVPQPYTGYNQGVNPIPAYRPQPTPQTQSNTPQILSTVGNVAQQAGAVVGQGGNNLGNAISTIAPALNVIPGWGQIAAPIASAVGGIINMFGHKKPEYIKPDVKIIRSPQNYNPFPNGTGSQGIFKNGGELNKAPNGTTLTPTEQKQYSSWRSRLPKSLQYEGDYDLKGLWKSNPNAKPTANMHFPDTYKLPNHPTFSNESIYFDPNTNLDSAGQWQKTDTSFNYIPFNPEYRDTVIEKMKDGGDLTAAKAKEILKDGTINNKKITEKQRKYFGYIAGGGKPKAADGIGIQVEDDKFTQLSPDTIQLNGAPHSQGGQDLYDQNGNKLVEAEGGETVTQFPDKTTVFGQMQVPGTNKSFKNVSKDLAAKEEKAQKFRDKGTDLVLENDPNDKLGVYAFNSGQAMMEGGQAKMDQLQDNKEQLAATQEALLSIAEEQGVDPNDLSRGKINLEYADNNQAPNGLTTPKQFTEDYINSPVYRSRLEKAGYSDIDAEIAARLQGVQDTNRIINQDGTPGLLTQLGDKITGMPYSPSGGSSAAPQNAIIMDTQQVNSLKTPYNDILTHEFSHKETGGRLNAADQGQLQDRLKQGVSGHDSLPEENKADLNAVRYQLFKQGVDVMNQDIKASDLDKLKNSGTATSKRLLNNYKDEDLLWLLNNVAINNENITPNTAENGTTMEAPNGVSMAQRNNNPGNLKYAPWMKEFGAIPTTDKTENDGTVYAKFPSVEQGQAAMKNLLFNKYSPNTTVDKAISVWTNNQPYDASLTQGISNKTLGQLNDQEKNQLLNAITQGEDSTTYNWTNSDGTPIQRPTAQPEAPIDPTAFNQVPDQSVGTVQSATPVADQAPAQPRPVAPSFANIFTATSPNRPLPSNAEPFNPLAILPELTALRQNEQGPGVFQQTYNPQLFEPYQVSFQDRINNNNRTFNALQQNAQVANDPQTLATLAGQLYGANNQVSAEQFRTNQAIANEVTNKNISLLNEAQATNLKLQDQAYVRQSQAATNTKNINYGLVNSIVGKILQHNLENKALQATEATTDYRMVNGQFQNVSGLTPGQELNWGTGINPFTPIPTVQQTVKRDAQGNIINSTSRTTTKPRK